ncbi:uncharacterized protein LOC124317966 isoform X2 [Daphnia pulicaria]|uniref:uncharacterized protein LOC124317966 isoform X2 n=1 Tax=Daphnia pulicaria TaxID=35523 RepID=UPI001EEC325D|nr:uncharacterized protein LOC124317966 isoform X2 [Daphnia pulicaria]
MDNETGLAILSAVLNGMSYPNRILTTENDNSTGIDVKDLHKILLKGCRYPPELENKPDTPANGNKTDIENCKETVKELGNENVKLEDAEKFVNIDVFVGTMEVKPLPLTLKPTTTIAELKEMISSSKEIPPNSQRVIFAINLHENINVDDQSA